VDDINATWKLVASKVGIDVNVLKEKILPLSALYSVAEHSRSALFAISDGALPNNVGGGYNLRVIIRRAMDFIDKYNWDVTMNDIVEWHAKYLEPLFPELSENLDSVKKILDVEREKYKLTKKKSKQIIFNLLDKSDKISEKKFIELYISQGISPEMIQEQAKKLDMKLVIPDDFYSKVSELKKEEQIKPVEKENLPLEKIADTEILYFKDFAMVEFTGTILKIIGNKVILNRTAFYPTSGGQIHDLGTIEGIKVIDIYKQGSHVIHVLEKSDGLKVRETVHGKIDFERRLQLAQHHTSTHIINGCAKKVLGNHIWQAGAHKGLKKARLDITHYESLTDEKVKEIERLANDIIEENMPVYSDLMKKDIAEKKYGFTLYQGGAVPGKVLRIISIPDFDTEACGGTHLHLTGEAKIIKILKTSKIQDGMVRIEFAAGKAAATELQKETGVLQEAALILDCQLNQIPARSQELFNKWKKVVKKKKIESDNDFKLLSTEESEDTEPQLLKNVALILKN